MSNKKHTSLRIDEKTMHAIEESCEERPGNVSANTWISEAIAEKLQREGRTEPVPVDA